MFLFLVKFSFLLWHFHVTYLSLESEVSLSAESEFLWEEILKLLSHFLKHTKEYHQTGLIFVAEVLTNISLDTGYP